jgi:hypothetical protein
MPTLTLLAAFLVFATGAPGAAPGAAPAAAAPSPLRHVRSTQPRIESLLQLGVRRSATFARLRDTLESTDLIVYVQAVPDMRHGLNGRLTFINSTPTKRYLRIDVRCTLTQHDLLATIAHELQHAVEIAGAANVRDTHSMIDFYRRIGLSRRALTGFETSAARKTESRVKTELLGA